MATQAQLLTVLKEATGPMRQAEIGAKLGIKISSFSGQLRTLEKQKFVSCNEDGAFTITDAGSEELQKLLAIYAGVGNLPSEEELQATEQGQFIKLAKNIGITPESFIMVLAEHVWNGGDFRDLTWVAKALVEMNVRQELRERLHNAWRSYLHQPISQDAATILAAASKGEAGTSTGTETKEGRDFRLDKDDKPEYVGAGLGDLFYKDAVELAKVRAASKGRVEAKGEGLGTMADEVVKIVNAVKTVTGNGGISKPYILIPTEDGVSVQELDPSKPLVIPQLGREKQTGSTWVVDGDEVKEVKPGQPVIITKESAGVATSGGNQVLAKQYLIDQATGKVTEVTPGTPIIIQMTPQTGLSKETPIQLRDKDGNPIVLDISTFFKLEEHKQKMQHDDEVHDAKVEIAKGFKDLLNKAGKALTHMAEEEGK